MQSSTYQEYNVRAPRIIRMITADALHHSVSSWSDEVVSSKRQYRDQKNVVATPAFKMNHRRREILAPWQASAQFPNLLPTTDIALHSPRISY
jgi:hypothetical protein